MRTLPEAICDFNFNKKTCKAVETMRTINPDNLSIDLAINVWSKRLVLRLSVVINRLAGKMMTDEKPDKIWKYMEIIYDFEKTFMF
jgi:hypothetical protein